MKLINSQEILHTHAHVRSLTFACFFCEIIFKIQLWVLTEVHYYEAVVTIELLDSDIHKNFSL
jgi:hypothetical protein